jgi:hypothetical protein
MEPAWVPTFDDIYQVLLMRESLGTQEAFSELSECQVI